MGSTGPENSGPIHNLFTLFTVSLRAFSPSSPVFLGRIPSIALHFNIQRRTHGQAAPL